MRAVVALSLFAFGASLTSPALARPDTRKMTCEQTWQLVRQEGAIVLSTGQRTFDRYVAAPEYCQQNEVLRQELVPTLDNQRCVLYNCFPYGPDDYFFDY